MIDPHIIGMVAAIWGGLTLFFRDERKRLLAEETRQLEALGATFTAAMQAIQGGDVDYQKILATTSFTYVGEADPLSASCLEGSPLAVAGDDGIVRWLRCSVERGVPLEPRRRFEGD